MANTPPMTLFASMLHPSIEGTLLDNDATRAWTAAISVLGKHYKHRQSSMKSFLETPAKPSPPPASDDPNGNPAPSNSPTNTATAPGAKTASFASVLQSPPTVSPGNPSPPAKSSLKQPKAIIRKHATRINFRFPAKVEKKGNPNTAFVTLLKSLFEVYKDFDTTTVL